MLGCAENWARVARRFPPKYYLSAPPGRAKTRQPPFVAETACFFRGAKENLKERARRSLKERPRIGKHFNLAGKGGRRIYAQQKSGAAPQREDEDGPLRLRVDEEVAVGDGDAAVGAVGEVPRVEVELDERRLVASSPFCCR